MFVRLPFVVLVYFLNHEQSPNDLLSIGQMFITLDLLEHAKTLKDISCLSFRVVYGKTEKEVYYVLSK
jgi:hypothetical protein